MNTQPVLQPGITAMPEVSDDGIRLFQSNIVWDNTLACIPSYNIDEPETTQPRFRRVGIHFASLSLAGGADIQQRQDTLVQADSAADNRQAKQDNKQVVNFYFQETLPFDNSLEMIQVYYDLGVRQAMLAYNQKNLIGDSCAEVTDGYSETSISVIPGGNWLRVAEQGWK